MVNSYSFHYFPLVLLTAHLCGLYFLESVPGRRKWRAALMVFAIADIVFLMGALLRRLFVTSLGLDTHLFIFVSVAALIICLFLLSASDRTVQFKGAVITIVLFCLWTVEFFFANFYIATDTTDFTYASRKWYRKYWKPIDTDGFREREYGGSVTTHDNVVAVIGDSFTAGAGIKFARDRYSNQLSEKLGPGWVVLNRARNGMNSAEEIQLLESLHGHYRGIILGYYLNDIFSAIEGNKDRFMPPLPPPNRFWNILVNNSAAANYLYWRIRVRQSYGTNFDQTLARLFENPQIWERHREQLRQLVGVAKKRNAFFMVVVFPSLFDVAGSISMTKQVAAVFRDEGAIVIDMSDYLIGMKPQKLVVNAADAHPNKFVHHLVAEKLFERFPNK